MEWLRVNLLTSIMPIQESSRTAWTTSASWDLTDTTFSFLIFCGFSIKLWSANSQKRKSQSTRRHSHSSTKMATASSKYLYCLCSSEAYTCSRPRHNYLTWLRKPTLRGRESSSSHSFCHWLWRGSQTLSHRNSCCRPWSTWARTNSSSWLR